MPMSNQRWGYMVLQVGLADPSGSGRHNISDCSMRLSLNSKVSQPVFTLRKAKTPYMNFSFSGSDALVSSSYIPSRAKSDP